MSRRSIPGRGLGFYLANLFGRRAVPPPEAHPGEPGEAAGYESKDVNATAVLLTGVGVLILLWACVVVIYPVMTYFESERGLTTGKLSEMPIPLPPQPRVQSNPREDLRDFRAREISDLNSYRWVNRKKNVITIPIGRAIQILAQRGVPSSRPGGDKYYAPQAGTRETGFEGKVEPEPR